MPEPNVNPEGNNDNTNTGVGNDESWYKTLPQDMHEHVKNFSTQEDAFKDYVGMKGKVPVVPEKSEDYKYDIPESIPKDQHEGFNKWLSFMRTEAKELGMTQKQFEVTVKRQIELGSKNQEESQKRAKEASEQAIVALKTEWGNEYETKMKRADNLATELFDDEFKTFGKKSGLFSHPSFVKGMYNLSKHVSEDTFIKSEPAAGTDKEGPERDPNTGFPMLKFNENK